MIDLPPDFGDNVKPARRGGRSARLSRAFHLRIALDGFRPEVWRLLAVPADIRLDRLHWVLNAAMGWENCHLHAFKIDGVEYQRPFHDDPFLSGDFEDETRFRLCELVEGAGEVFEYHYDFGDDWMHTVDVMADVTPPRPLARPILLAGAGACPPEDSGGWHGLSEMLKARKNRKHPMHRDAKAWLPKGFDPERFDLTEANERISELKV